MVLADTLYAQARGALERQVALAAAAAPDGPRVLPLIALVPTAGSALVPAGWTGAAAALPSGTRLHVQARVAQTSVTGHNVVAIVPGRDPALATTYVAFGAHYDHIGIQPPVNGDSIANGADDDGSGSVTLLALARSFVQGPHPRRSILLVWHVGEKGILGSQWFTDHPTVPIDSIVAQLNADMIGRNGRGSLYVMGPNAAPGGQSRVVGQVLDSVNATLAPPFVFLREYDTPTHPERIYYRSDHYNYARKGIPIVFVTTGLHGDYHKVSDEPQKIEYDEMARVGTLLHEAGLALANRPTRPK